MARKEEREKARNSIGWRKFSQLFYFRLFASILLLFFYLFRFRWGKTFFILRPPSLFSLTDLTSGLLILFGRRDFFDGLDSRISTVISNGKFANVDTLWTAPMHRFVLSQLFRQNSIASLLTNYNCWWTFQSPYFVYLFFVLFVLQDFALPKFIVFRFGFWFWWLQLINGSA